MITIRPGQIAESLLMFAFLILPFFSIAQTVEHDNPLFTFKVHDNLKPEVLEGIPVYTSGTIFLNIKSIDTYENAGKYADALEDMFLDQDEVYTDRGIDTLDGWPLITILRTDESKDPDFVQRFYLFDGGGVVYSLSISGYKTDERVIQDYFSVTKNSFKFKTRTQTKLGLSLPLPKFMTEDNVMFWSHLYNKDEAVVNIPIYFYHDKEAKSYDNDVKETVKNFKSLKPSASTQEEFTTASGVRVTKFMVTYMKKLKTTSEEQLKCLFTLQHPEGGVLSIHFTGQPAVVALMGPRLEKVIKAGTF